MNCENGKDDLADGQEVSLHLSDHLEPEIFSSLHQVNIETPNYPGNYPDKAKCNWKIKVPANEEVHIWCETFDLVRKDFLRVRSVKNIGYSTAFL